MRVEIFWVSKIREFLICWFFIFNSLMLIYCLFINIFTYEKALQNSTIGIFGLGTIGMSVAKSFEPRQIIYTSRKPNANAAKLGFENVCFDELLAKSDFLICTCSLNKETELIFNKQAFSIMKTSTVFINVSRGIRMICMKR